MKAYCGFIKNEKTLFRSASGGLATAMTEHVVKDGGVVYGVAYSDDFKSCSYIRCTDDEAIKKLQSSKYIKATLGAECLNSIAADLSNGYLVLCIGLPCEIYAIINFLSKKNVCADNLITVDLICHGSTSAKVAEQYIGSLEKKYKSKVIEFSVRYKKAGWTPPYLYAKFENGKTYCDLFYGTDYGVAFAKMTLPSCSSCKFKGENHKADITIGDYWGATECDAGYNKMGTSVAFVYNGKGEEFIHSLDNFELFDADLKKALDNNPRYSCTAKKTADADKFRRNFGIYGLRKAVSKSRTLKTKLKSFVRKIFKKAKS